jgi:UDP-GlcNAc:undecaprenyl-phosphate GlcNAc-1-phosphate transferase
MAYLLPFLLAMVVTLVWLPLFGRWAGKMHFLDQPGARKVHAVAIPRIGGVAMALGISVTVLMVVPLQVPDRYFLVASGIIVLFGAIDDRFDLDYRVKLLGQVLAAFLVVLGGDIQIHALTLTDRVVLPEWISVPLTLFFLIGITNAINLADGLDGLAGGTTFLSLCALAILAYSAGQVTSAALALTFAGAVLGFLRFNTFPASVFMGDAGSQLLGFAVGVLSLRATQSGGSEISAATPVLLLALPILDTLSVMVQRIGEGRSPFSPDKNHIHHKLLRFGFFHHEAVMVIYAVQADLFLLAYWMRYESDLAILGTVSAFFVVTLALLYVAERHHWQFRTPGRERGGAAWGRFAAAALEPNHLPRWSYIAIAAGVCFFAALVVAQTGNLSNDVLLLLVALMLITVVAAVLLRDQPMSIVEKGVLYVTAAVVAYLDSQTPYQHLSVAIVSWTAIITAAAGTVVRVRLSNERRFELTPLDLIVVFVALVLPSLPGSTALPHGGALGIAKLVVLFYAVEVLVTRLEVRALWLRIGAVAIQAGLVLIPLL